MDTGNTTEPLIANPVADAGTSSGLNDSRIVASTEGDLISPHGIVKMGLSWEVAPGLKVDLDASAVCFDHTGVVIDAAFYNQLSACNGGITHSGDCKDGSIEGFDEVITVDLDKTFGCDVVALVLSSSSGGTLKSCETADLEISQNGVVIQKFPCIGPQTGNYTNLIVGMIYKDFNTMLWRYKTVFQPAQGRHFSACLKQLRSVVETVLDPNNVGERVMSHEKTFTMGKNAVMQFPADVKEVNIGLGWTTPQDNLDLDAGCIMLREIRTSPGQYEPADVVYFGNKVKNGVMSMGDNTTGAGSGDDETIKVFFDQIPQDCAGLVFVVNIYTLDRSFAEVTDSYVRVVDPKGGHEYIRFKLDNSLKTSGVIFCTIMRDPQNPSVWDLTSIGQDCGGRTVREVKCHLFEGVWDNNAAFAGSATDSTNPNPMVRNKNDGCACCVIA
jgi:tellurium resistance protein TerD